MSADRNWSSGLRRLAETPPAARDSAGSPLEGGRVRTGASSSEGTIFKHPLDLEATQPAVCLCACRDTAAAAAAADTSTLHVRTQAKCLSMGATMGAGQPQPPPSGCARTFARPVEVLAEWAAFLRPSVGGWRAHVGAALSAQLIIFYWNRDAFKFSVGQPSEASKRGS